FYLSTAKKDKEINRINEWIEEIRKQPFKHILLLTFDSSWKKNEHAMEGELLWFPTIQTGHLHSDETNAIIKDQVSQMIDLVRSYWQDRKSTRLNSSHVSISYAVFCLKKKKTLTTGSSNGDRTSHETDVSG